MISESNVRLKKLSKEIERVNENELLSDEDKERIKRSKYDALFKPCLLSLSQLKSKTIDLYPATPQERKFVNKYQTSINKAYK